VGVASAYVLCMDSFIKLDELRERKVRLFNTLIRACAAGWPTEGLTKMFLDAEQAEKQCHSEAEQ
jgi:hypothetical protein